MNKVICLSLLSFILIVTSCEFQGRGLDGGGDEIIVEDELPEGCYETFCIQVSETSSTIEVELINKQITAITAVIEFQTTGLIADQSLPVSIFINEVENIDIISFEKNGDAWSIGYNIKYNYGYVDGEHDNSVIYQLPFEVGTSQEVTQGYNGSFSHDGINAIDFDMSEGTRVYAMRKGTVVKIEERYSEGGVDESLYDLANYVYILHDDKTIAKYAHLQQNSVNVSIGQFIFSGTVIGLSGNTGYSSGPHLHIGIVGLVENLDEVSFRTSFKTSSSAIGEELVKGESYMAIQL